MWQIVFSFQTLYTYPENFRAYKVLAAANYSGFNLKVDASFQYGTTNRTPEFLAKFPLGKVRIVNFKLISSRISSAQAQNPNLPICTNAEDSTIINSKIIKNQNVFYKSN